VATDATAGEPGADDGIATGDPAPDDAPDSDPFDPCTVLFGLPNEKTGLTAEQCRPSCDCDALHFTPPTYTEAQIQDLEARILMEPFDVPTEDPYAHPELHVPAPGKVCGVVPDATMKLAYSLATFDSAADAALAGAQITHRDACGLCSPLKDLAVYMRNPDLTAPVRQCGLLGMARGDEARVQCLLDLGFDAPCAAIWSFNTVHTQQECGSVCMALLDAPYHEPDGSLNACLQCDEDASGAVFKAVAGRTRRNTGLPSSMCRPCSEVVPVVHAYL
jgi:hypothetical protein